MRNRRIELLWLTLTAFLLLLSAWWLPGSGHLNTDSYSVSFAGRKVLFQTLQRLDENVQRSNSQLVPRPDAADRLLILGPARYPTAEEWDELHTAVLDGVTLIFAASARDPLVDAGPFGARVESHGLGPFGIKVEKDGGKAKTGTQDRSGDAAAQSDDAAPDDADKSAAGGGTTSEEVTDEDAAAEEVADEEEVMRELEDLFQLRGEKAETELVDTEVFWKSNAEIDTDSDDWDVLLSVEDSPQVVRRRFGLGTFILVASDEIFSNGAMLEPERAVLAYRILDAGDGPFETTWFDETLNASGVPQVLGILFAVEFRPITLQLLLALILFGWLGSRRFGPVERTQRSRRRSIVEHAEAVGILYYRGSAGAHAVRALREFLRQELRRLSGPGFRVDDPAAVARQTQTVEADVRELFETIDGIETFDTEVNKATAVRLLRGLSTLLSRVRKDSASDDSD